MDYAKENNAIILFDGAYEAFITEPNVPHSIFEIEGAKDVAVEFRSFSKTAGFTGTRCAYTVIPKSVKVNGVELNKLWLRRQCTKFNGVPYVIQRAAAAVYSEEGKRQVRENILYYLENDLRFQHAPFAFSGMEDAVERIMQAKEEGEKVLIFGDSDVDGVTSTAILYEQLVRMGLDVSWRLPLEDDGYGLSIAAIDDFAAQEGSLIITVDCGISNNQEISHANELGIDVIVTDHHNPPEELPEAIIIIDPKIEETNYPFDGISGAAVAYKLVSALRFADSVCFFSRASRNRDVSGSTVCIEAGRDGFWSQYSPILSGAAVKGSMPG